MAYDFSKYYDQSIVLTPENLEDVAGGIKWGQISADERTALAFQLGLTDENLASLRSRTDMAAADREALADINLACGQDGRRPSRG